MLMLEFWTWLPFWPKERDATVFWMFVFFRFSINRFKYGFLDSSSSTSRLPEDSLVS
jgi:hypothetical protein